jgi:hypothetical protein
MAIVWLQSSLQVRLAHLHDANDITKVQKVQVVVAQPQRFQGRLASLLQLLGAAKHYKGALVITGLPERHTPATMNRFLDITGNGIA